MHVLISGAGIAGPTLAYFLSKIPGAQITVLEKAKSFLAQGQNIDIHGSAITAVKKMGLMDEIKRFNTTEKGTHIVDSKGRAFATFPCGGGRFSMTDENEILRGDLADVLYQASKDLPNVRYLFSTTLKSVLSNDDQAVKVELSDGSIHSYDYAVASDGQWSKLRRLTIPASNVTVKDTGMYAVYYTLPRLPSDNDWWNIYVVGGSRIASNRPDPHGTIRACLTYMPTTDGEKRIWEAASRDRKAQQDLMRKTFAGAGWQTQRLLDCMESASDFYFHPIQQIRMSTWHSGRVVCLGDAAYAPTPLTGAGATLAITGAYILAGEISKLSPSAHPKAAFEAYETVFKPHVDSVQQIPSFVPGVMHPKGAWGLWLVQMFLWSLAKIVAGPIGTWLATGRVDAEKNDDGFALPVYPTLDALSSEKKANGVAS